jgi:hypothetical protein
MAQGVCSMARELRNVTRILVVSWVATFLALTGISCGKDLAANGSRLEPTQVAASFRQLPYGIKMHQLSRKNGTEVLFRGTARSKKGVSAAFAISVGDEPSTPPVPLSGIRYAIGHFSLGFVFNDNAAVVRRSDTKQTWRERITMVQNMEQSLCRAATGESCPI